MIKKLLREIGNILRYNHWRGSVRVGTGCNLKGSSFSGKNMVGSNTKFVYSHCGKYSYMGDNCDFSHMEIGSFCSIASNVKLIVGEHPTRTWVSTSPMFYSSTGQCGTTFVKKDLFDERKYVDQERNLYAIIGNDVWMCQDARILSGVKVGDGAIIAAGALVTKNVPEFAIVAGVPSKIIGYRFSEEDRNILLETKWWLRDEDWLLAHASQFINLEELAKAMQE